MQLFRLRSWRHLARTEMPYQGDRAGLNSEEGLPKQLLSTTGQSHRHLTIPADKPKYTAPRAGVR